MDFLQGKYSKYFCFSHLYSENKTLSLAQLEQLHNCKTGALIQASVQLGATAANANAQQMNALTEFAQKIGLAFQVVDDILDLESDTQTLGKPQGSDLAHNKATYPALLGLAGAKQKANELFDQAIHCLMPFAQHAEFLRLLAAFIVQRKY